MIALLLQLALAEPPEEPVTPTPGSDAPPADVPPDQANVLGVLIGDQGAMGSLIGPLGPPEDRPRGGSVDPSEVHVDFDDPLDELRIFNDKPYPITFTADLSQARNVRMFPRHPFQKVLRPGDRRTLRFATAGPGTMSYSYTWSWTTGSFKAKHKPPGPYHLPWPDDLSFECTQGFDGDYSHDGEHALDIVMPEGTPILAARGGTVISIVDGWGPGAPDKRYYDEANSLRILHEDGTYADYLHLQAGGMKVTVGDRVERGQVVATSGNSGYSRRPHLHFVVKSALDGWVTRSWPVRFEVRGQSLVLRPGKWYPPQD